MAFRNDVLDLPWEELDRDKRKIPLFTLKTIIIKETERVIKALKNKKSSGFDGISSRILKDIADVLAVPLTEIINTSITSGEFPQRWMENSQDNTYL